jgi:outer membrane protein OmpA-like peptidoglycan-associated protein
VHAGDTCLKSNPSFGSVPSRLTLGARAFALVDGLSFHAALDLATGGNAPLFWEEVQPEAPWNLHFGLSYAADTEPRIERVLVKQPAPEVTPEKPKPVVRYVVSGVVVEEGAEDVTVPNAIIRYQGRDLTGMISNAQGAFQTSPLEPGSYVFDITAPDYQPGTCQVVVAPAPEPGSAEAEAGADGVAAGELSADATAGTDAPSGADPLAGPAPDSADPDAPRERVEVTEVRCPLKGKPKLGTVVVVVTDAATQAPIAGATVTPTTEDGRSLSLESDESGATRFSNVPVGGLKIVVQAPGYYKTQRQIKVQAGQEHNNTIEVSKVGPRTIAVGKTNLTLKKPLAFKPGTAELLPESRPVLDELAQLLADQPKLAIELQAHTDDTLPPPAAVSLTSDRANAIRSQLVASGVAAGRVSALGMGAEKPLVPNTSDKNKEKNNRVEIVVKSAP